MFNRLVTFTPTTDAVGRTDVIGSKRWTLEKRFGANMPRVSSWVFTVVPCLCS